MPDKPKQKRRGPKTLDIATTVDGERLLPMRAVMAITSWSRTSIYRLVGKGQFPSPVQLGDNRIAFREADIAAYVASRQCRPRLRPIPPAYPST